jgi:hypothetical protein
MQSHYSVAIYIPWLVLVSLMCFSEAAIADTVQQLGYGMVNWDSIPGRGKIFFSSL